MITLTLSRIDVTLPTTRHPVVSRLTHRALHKHWDTTALPKRFTAIVHPGFLFEMRPFPGHCALPSLRHEKTWAFSVLSRAALLTPLSYPKVGNSEKCIHFPKSQSLQMTDLRFKPFLLGMRCLLPLLFLFSMVLKLEDIHRDRYTQGPKV